MTNNMLKTKSEELFCVWKILFLLRIIEERLMPEN